MLKRLKNRIKYKFFPHNLTNEEYIDYLKSKGIVPGKGTIFYGANLWVVDIQRPWLIEIGEYCKITRGVQILAHDYSRSVLRRKYGEIIAESKKTIIGNNVFIGTNSVILMGARIGNNVIIGAGSVVSGTIPDDVVIAGNPARIIRTLDEHYQVRKAKSEIEAKQCAVEYYNHFGKLPSVKEMEAFFPLYLNRDIKALHDSCVQTKLGGDDEESVIQDFLVSDGPVYRNYEAFLNAVKGELGGDA